MINALERKLRCAEALQHQGDGRVKKKKKLSSYRYLKKLRNVRIFHFNDLERHANLYAVRRLCPNSVKPRGFKKCLRKRKKSGTPP